MFRHPLTRFLTFLLVLAVLTGCGVRFLESAPETELFKDIELSEPIEAGEQITVTLTLNPSYPVPLRIACLVDSEELTDDEKLVAFQERAGLVGETVLPPALDTAPEDEVEPLVLRYDFVVEEPGEYFIACITAAAPENGLGLPFEIE